MFYYVTGRESKDLFNFLLLVSFCVLAEPCGATYSPNTKWIKCNIFINYDSAGQEFKQGPSKMINLCSVVSAGLTHSDGSWVGGSRIASVTRQGRYCGAVGWGSSLHMAPFSRWTAWASLPGASG